MTFLHTADLHIGQLFYDYDRLWEHQQMLNWLVQTLVNHRVDCLLISGDVFDSTNPSAAAVRLFYSFLNQATKALPNLQIIVTAGNHDSASRLESPKPLLESSNIHIIGTIEKDEAGKIQYDKLLIPLFIPNSTDCCWVMAVPFLRVGDYPSIADKAISYAEGVTSFYQHLYEYTLSIKKDHEPIVALGHLHALNAELLDDDKTERMIMGGVEFVPVTAFHKDIAYTALGHIHKAQMIGGRDNVRYSGSPLPMSFSELNYHHQVILFTLNENKVTAIQSISVPVSIPLLRVPHKAKELSEVLKELELLPLANEMTLEKAPYLDVQVLLKGPEPTLKAKIEAAIKDKYVRLAKIEVKYGDASISEIEASNNNIFTLKDLQPFEVFERAFKKEYKSAVPESLIQLFHQVVQDLQ